MLKNSLKCISSFIISLFIINISFGENLVSKEERMQTEIDTTKSIFIPEKIQAESNTMRDNTNIDGIKRKKKEQMDILAVSFAGGVIVGIIIANVIDDPKTGGELYGLNYLKDISEFFGGFIVGFIVTAVVSEKIIRKDNNKKSDKINNIFKNINISVNKNKFGNKLFLINYNYRFN